HARRDRGAWIIRTSAAAVIDSPRRRPIHCPAMTPRGTTTVRASDRRVAGRAAHRLAAHRTAIGATAGRSTNRPPAERLGGERYRKHRTQAAQDQPIHGLVPLGLAGVAGLAGFSSTWV